MSILVLHTQNASRRMHFARAQEYAKEHGERLLVIVKRPTWETQYVDRVYSANTADIAETVESAKELIAEETEPVRAVIAFVEHSVPAGAAVAEALGLPFVSPRTAQIARDKYAMRRAFETAGISQPRFGLARTVHAALGAADHVGYPMVLKPLIGGGSMYVRRVNNADEVKEHFEPIRQGSWDGFDYDPLYESALEKYRGALLLEAYVAGAEISVESIVFNGRTEVVAIHDKPLPMNGPFFEEVYYATPTSLDPQVAERVREITVTAHEALGITVGATHTEFRIQNDGEPMILETAARLGGGPIYQSVRLSTGVDMVKAVLDAAFGKEPDVLAKPARPTGFYLFFADKAGRIKAINGVEEAREDPHVKELQCYCNVGDQVNVPPHVWQAHGHVIFTADTKAKLGEIFDRLVKTIRFDIE